MALLSQYERYQEYIFTECSLQYIQWFYAENSQSQKMTLAGFSQKGSQFSEVSAYELKKPTAFREYILN